MKETRTTFGLFLSVFLMMVGVGMIVAVMPRRYVALSGSPHTVGSLAASFALTYLAVQFIVGRLADRRGFKPFLVAGYFVCALAGLCFTLGESAAALIFGRIIQGVGEAPVWSLAPAVLASLHPGRAGRLIGGYNAVLHLGLTLGPGVGLLIGLRLPEAAVFAAYAMLCLAGGSILIGTLGADARVRIETGALRGLDTILPYVAARRNLSLTLAGAGLYGAGYGAFLTVIPVFLQLVKGFDALGVGMFFSGFYLAVGLAALFTGPLTDRYGRRGFMPAGMGLAAVGLFLTPALEGVGLAGLLILSIFALGSFGVSSLAYLNEMAPAGHKGTFSGIYFLFWGLGMFGGPILIGGLDAWTGPGSGLRGFGVVMALYGLLSGWIGRRDGL